MELFITRHGETIGNVQRTIQGQQGGQLTELGFEQAYKLGERLKEYNFNAIISSDLNRCQQTLAPIAVHHQYLTPVLDPRIREKGAGEVEGQPLGTTDRMAKSLDISPREFRPIGGECWLDVNQRAKIFLKDMCDQYMNDEHMNKILVISHGG